MNQDMLIDVAQLTATTDAVIFDCRFSLADKAEGRSLYAQGHIPGAIYMDLERDMSAAIERHGGRHPLPAPGDFAATLARSGVGPNTRVIAYDDSRLAFASRLWWMMRALGYRPPQLLNGGYRAYLDSGAAPGVEVCEVSACVPAPVNTYAACIDFSGLRAAMESGALLVDSREPQRYAGLAEPIDPVAGHIPGAINRPWQGVTSDDGRVIEQAALLELWGDALDASELVVYCGSGVTACVNLFALALIGREATLYAGSWSDWCSYLPDQQERDASRD